MSDASDPTTDLHTLRDRLDLWGSNLNNWPRAEADHARALLDASSEAQALFASAEQLQALLDALPAATAPIALKMHIAANPPLDFFEQLSGWFSRSLWRPLLAGSLPLVIGFALGFTMTVNPADEMAEQISLLSLTTSFEEFNDDL
jgi:hypothetical protein